MESEIKEIAGILTGFFQSKAVSAALELRIFDAIDPPARAEVVCRRAGVPLASGKRLLIALEAMKLIFRENDEYRLSDAAKRCLVSTSPQWMGWMARHCDVFLYPLWGHCAEAIRQNEDRRTAVFGDNRSWFDILYQNPRDVADFQEFLGVLAQPFVDGVIESFDFSAYKRLIDIGSGCASLPMSLARSHPELEVAVCELPQAAAFVREKLNARGFENRIAVFEGDVIEGALPGGFDLIHLGWMLHDYAIETQRKILKNILAVMPSSGTFVASETPLNDDESGPLFTSLLSINMLLSTDGGVESTTEEYLDRFRDAGFVNVRAQTIPGPRKLLIGQKA
ncbi:methyltransferase [Methylosinus sp. Sm6]|uniref:methyltransferase n=1 Tax=Methylosinus sp. Sm6 TaxID=2866948 RepID=UPI001C99CBCD|nr:methyltransferase [Methylosinus sp. Sm6]MBY6243038.1 methyltransferase [Methylosinus sp. Sm6]